uniref:N-acetyltransferase domain-containing protein n=1 Tax=Meloidogyne floridensis TaxID=298350 RepID=A0A915NZL4_9BILA
MEINFLKPNDKKEEEEVLQFLLDHFLIDEPLFEGLKIKIIKICSQEPPISMLVRSKNEENKLVAVMLGQLINRYEPQNDFYKIEGEKTKYSPNVDIYCKLVHLCESSVWDLLPKNMVKLCSVAFLSVHKDYRKLGIGYQTIKELVNYLRQMGNVQGFVSELSAAGTQKLNNVKALVYVKGEGIK